MLKKKNLTVLFVLISLIAYPQKEKDFIPEGSPFMKVYFDYHSNFENISRMEIKRAYLGYNYKFSQEFSAKMNIDVGKIEGKYLAYLKIAQMQYKKGRTTIKAGMIATKQFKVQEKFWGYRYLLKSLQDEYKFNASADIGMSLDWQIMKRLSLDFIVQNGEGYKNIEPTGTFRGGMGVRFLPIESPVESLTLRAYADLSAKPRVKRISYATFAGYRYKKKFRIAVEFNYQIGTDFNSNRGISGASIYSTYVFSDKINVFARYDLIEYYELNFQAVLSPEPWNIEKNGSGPILGIEYMPLKGIYISSNYRAWKAFIETYYESMFYLNFAYQIK